MKTTLTFILLFLALVLVFFVSGCSTTYLRSGDTKFFRAAIGNRTEVSGIIGQIDTNGTRQIQLRGYGNDQVDGIREGARGAAQGAMQGLKP